jgi:hypothetical protein
LVPLAFSNRVTQEKGLVVKVPLGVLIVPFPA